MTGRGRAGGGGQGHSPGAESGQYFSKCPSENGRLDSPQPRRSLGASDSSMLGPCERQSPTPLTTQLRPISEPTAVRLQHMSNLYIWFCRKKNKKTFFRMSMYELEF